MVNDALFLKVIINAIDLIKIFTTVVVKVLDLMELLKFLPVIIFRYFSFYRLKKEHNKFTSGLTN